MKDFDDMTPAEREAWFAERLQVQHDDTLEEQVGERLWIGITIMIFLVATIIALNHWLSTQGYGA